MNCLASMGWLSLTSHQWFMHLLHGDRLYNIAIKFNSALPGLEQVLLKSEVEGPFTYLVVP